MQRVNIEYDPVLFEKSLKYCQLSEDR